MLFKLVTVLVLSSLIAHYGHPAQMRHSAQQSNGVKTLQAASHPEGVPPAKGTQSDHWSDNAKTKGVLERRFRLRPRLNTHLLMLKFQR
jgi:hypothetical protein